MSTVPRQHLANPPTIPHREGPRPAATPTVPHVQLDQNGSPDLYAALMERVFALPNIEQRETVVSAPGAKAIWLKDDVAAGPPDAFLGYREIGHFHPWDHSMHIALPPELAVEAVENGWAEIHPVALAGSAPRNVVMLYAAREEQDVKTLHRLVARAIGRAANGRG